MENLQSVKVSIVIPTYNRPDKLKRLLKSIFLQTHQNFEVIVIDDHSPTSYEDVKDWAKRQNSTLKFLRNSINRGAPTCRNRGIRESVSNWIALVDDDDEWMPKKLETQLNLVKKSGPNLAIVYSWAKVINEKNGKNSLATPTIEKSAPIEILKKNFIPSPTVLVRKKAIDEVGGFDPLFPAYQDWDMWTRIIAEGWDIKVAPSVLATYYSNAENQSAKNIGNARNAVKGLLRFYTKNRNIFFRQGLGAYWAKSLLHCGKVGLKNETKRYIN